MLTRLSALPLRQGLPALILWALAAGTSTEVAADEPPRLRNELGMEFVRIPAGRFMMGSAAGAPGHEPDERRHQVTISRDFYLQTTPVTRSQWLHLVEGHPSAFPRCGDDCPVDSLKPRWVDYFITTLSERDPGYSYRLPTEAEWEYAARAGTATAFYTGDCLQPGQANVTGTKNLPGCEDFGVSAGPMPVASFPPNPWGLYDMAGNVWELCQDWYGGYSPEAVTDPQGPDSGSHRVIRGGSWRFYPTHARSANRFRNIRDIAGFRLVLVRED